MTLGHRVGLLAIGDTSVCENCVGTSGTFFECSIGLLAAEGDIDCEGKTGVDFGSKVGRLAAGDTPEGENDGLACLKGTRAGREGVGYGIWDNGGCRTVC